MNRTTKVALLLSMLLALNYPVGLHDLCLDLILQLRHTSNRLTKALVRLILTFGVRLCGKKKGLSTITKFKCQTDWIETRPDVFVSKVQAYLSLWFGSLRPINKSVQKTPRDDKMSWKHLFSFHKGERLPLRSAAPELSWLAVHVAVHVCEILKSLS